jgi:hypothetical protein
LATATRDALALAEILECAAGLLRGRPPDPDGPPLEICPGSAPVLSVLARRDWALAGAKRAWDRLGPAVRARLPAPRDLPEEADHLSRPGETSPLAPFPNRG